MKNTLALFLVALCAMSFAQTYDPMNPNPSSYDVFQAEQSQRMHEQNALGHSNNGDSIGWQVETRKAQQAEWDAHVLENRRRENEYKQRQEEQRIEDERQQEYERRRELETQQESMFANSFVPDPNFDPIAENAALERKRKLRESMNKLGQSKFVDLYVREKCKQLDAQNKKVNPAHPKRIMLADKERFKREALSIYKNFK